MGDEEEQLDEQEEDDPYDIDSSKYQAYQTEEDGEGNQLKYQRAIETARAAAQEKKKKDKKKKKIEKKAAIWLVTSGCSCCLPVLIFIATIGFVTICVFYVTGLFESDNVATPPPAANNVSK